VNKIAQNSEMGKYFKEGDQK